MSADDNKLRRIASTLDQATWDLVIDPQTPGERVGDPEANAAWDRAREAGPLVEIDVDPDTLEEQYVRTALGEQLLEHFVGLFLTLSAAEVSQVLCWSMGLHGGEPAEIPADLLARLQGTGFVNDGGATKTFLAMVTGVTEGRIAFSKEPGPEELPLPPLSTHNSEIARVWICGPELEGRDLRVMLRPACFSPAEDPIAGASSWGVALADIARHVANGLHDCRGVDRGLALARIQSLFNAELGQPTDEAETRRHDPEASS